ncbi:MAG TPA: hypothetical protein VGS19_13725 [Streptosporangiaceae bacterium]|nr:hypothetical protein [Streptosporangiaceae bacterium]
MRHTDSWDGLQRPSWGGRRSGWDRGDHTPGDDTRDTGQLDKAVAVVAQHARRLFVKVTPTRAGTVEPAGEPETLACPPSVEPETVRSFLVACFGEPLEVAWATTERHTRVQIGWFFAAEQSRDAEVADLLCVPLIDTGNGALQPMFEVQADQRHDS